ncbi:putative integral membrane protein (TIGR00698 family) [Salsuginibacillus halophilus]|uniref:Putative integral membrane protein (TIGR00698 family) n=1 Tax=Salsuginibacillus halophilus TaxID=517424 RepID=A0A2P8HL10_9BACI|nr:putative sulfate exporter family transporter [Salsuginibacillus halophilus]PSL46907.1 putative integral membrane protein (TIGR00698 family) [Salsuginibacillus halophilus]
MKTYINKLGEILPGVILCTVVMVGSMFIADWLGAFVNQLQGLPPESSSPISSIFIAIIAGLMIRNLIGLSGSFMAGVSFSVKVILKIGIILLGVRLSFIDVVTLGAWGIPIILICVVTGIFATLWVTARLQQSYRLGTLTAVGTGICGVTAIVGTAPGIKANDEEIAYAVGNITIFGILAMFLYPYMAHLIFQDDPVRAGLFLGTSIHETAQVAGGALIYEQMFQSTEVVDVATISKLTRNTLLVAVVPIMSYLYLKKGQASNEGNLQVKKWYQLIPLFVVGFLLMAGVRTIGDAGVTEQGQALGLFSPENWEALTSSLNTLGSTYLLGIAMAAVGLSTNLKMFKDLGAKPFYIGMVAAVTVTIVSIAMVMLLGGLIEY